MGKMTKTSGLIFKKAFFIILVSSGALSILLNLANAESSLTVQNTAPSEIKIPLHPKNWKPLAYSSLKANKISGDEKALVIEVDQSSSPLLYKLEATSKFKTVIVEGEIIEGQINLNGQKQGLFKSKKSFTDDYALRFGVVLKGKNKKPPVPGFLLASWIKEMFKLAPKGVGVDKIYFLKVVNDPKEIGQTRNHPLSDYLFEESMTSAVTGKFKIEKTFENPKEILGFWISANGEGTKSKFKTRITNIAIK